MPDIHQLIQVARNMDNPTTREREMRALMDGMGELGISSGLILTDTQSDEVTENGYTIQIRSLSEWLMDSWTV